MTRFVQSEDRRQGVLLPEYLDDYVAEDNPVRVIDVFVDELDLGAVGFDGVIPEATGRPAYHPGALLKIYVYGYVNQIVEPPAGARDPSQCRAADFRKDNGWAIRGPGASSSLCADSWVCSAMPSPPSTSKMQL